MFQLEVCVDSLESAVTAWKAGADRLEICENLSVGGVTPTAELVSSVKKSVSIPLFVIIRCRPGNFQYSPPEVEQMLEEIKIMKNLDVNGLVFGALDKDNNVDVSVCQQLLAASTGIPVTFHRDSVVGRSELVVEKVKCSTGIQLRVYWLVKEEIPFDEIINKKIALEEIIQLGFQRILTTGGPKTANEGIQELKALILQANSRIIIMPGGGVNELNILDILEGTKAIEFHSSARIADPDSPTSKSKECSAEVVRNMKSVLQQSR